MIFVGLLVCGGCGKGKDGAAGAATAVGAAGATGVAAAVVSPSGVVAPVAPVPAPPAVDLGSCELTGSGALSGHEVLPRNRGSVMTDYWFGAAEREQIQASTDGATAPLALSLRLLLLNCDGRTVSVSIVPGPGATEKTVPFGPKTYRLEKGQGELAVLAKVGDEMMVDPSGTIDVTAFDAHHIAATIDLAGTTADQRELKVSGKLDFVCDGMTGCK